MKKTGVQLIAAERKRQVKSEGWTLEHDDSHDSGQMALAAACYASGYPTKVRIEKLENNCGCREASCGHFGFFVKRWVNAWPWDAEWDKRSKHERKRQLVIAGALIAAEIDRLNRAQA